MDGERKPEKVTPAASLATWQARITVHNGGSKLDAPTVQDVERAVSKAVAELFPKRPGAGLIVNVDAMRTDL